MFDIEFYQKVYPLKQQLMGGARTLSREEVFEKLESFRSPKPVIYNIETTNACNMRCEMCPRTTMMTRSIATMNLDVFRRVAEQLEPFTAEQWSRWEKFVQANYGIGPDDVSENHYFLYVIPRVIVMHGYGDPLLDRHIPDEVRILTDRGIPSYFSCNPANIDIDRTLETFENGLAYVKYSIEAVDDERHKAVRGKASNFSDAYRKIMDVVELKAKRNLKTQIVITMLNLGKSWQRDDFSKLKEAFAGTGAYVYLKSQDQKWYEDNKVPTQSIHWTEFCQFPWSSMTIKSNGEAAECVEDFNNEVILGDARVQSLQEIWNGDKYRQLRLDHFDLKPGIKCTEECDMTLVGSLVAPAPGVTAVRRPTTGAAAARLELSALLDRDPAQIQARAATLFDELVPAGRPLVLFGAGGLGRKVLAGLLRHGVRPVAFADNATSLHGTKIDGIEVLSPAEAARRHGRDAAFVATVYVGNAAVQRQLRELGCTQVLHFYPLLWKYPEDLLPHYAFDLPHKVVEAKESIIAIAEYLADDASRREFIAQIRWRLDPSFDAFPPRSDQELYFPTDLVNPLKEEVFVDCGGYDGDTARKFVARTNGRFGKMVIFEPEPHNFSRLEGFVRTLAPEVAARVKAHRLALGKSAGTLAIEDRGAASAAGAQGGNVVPVVALDAALGDERATFIKMDIEGGELDALRGATGQLRHHRPLLAISAYHRQEDPWVIPTFLRDLELGYRLYLRRHTPEIHDDLVLYAVPGDRSKATTHAATVG